MQSLRGLIQTISFPFCLVSCGAPLFMMTTYCRPVIHGKENLKEICDTNHGKSRMDCTAVMLVANHSSWIDIPSVCTAIWFTNSKMVAKHELLKIPVLSQSQSQLETYRRGVKWLEGGVKVVVFPEGKTSKTGTFLPFKKGAFKMTAKPEWPLFLFRSISAVLTYSNILHRARCLLFDLAGRSRSRFIGKPICTLGKKYLKVTEEVWHGIAEQIRNTVRILAISRIHKQQPDKNNVSGATH